MSLSYSLSFRLRPPLGVVLGDRTRALSPCESIESAGEARPFSVGVAVCAREGRGRGGIGRELAFRPGGPIRCDMDIIGQRSRKSHRNLLLGG